MGHTLILEVLEELYEPLARTARQAGATPEKLAVEWLWAVSRTARDDPVENFIGALPSNTPDWPDRHDQYLGQALMEQPPGTGDKGG